LTPWSLPPPRVHVLLRGLCGGKVRPLGPPRPLIEICFFFFLRTGYGRA
jgi:hypothetical protein